MRNMVVHRLDWESDFFGFEIGQIDCDNSFKDIENYDLIIFKQKQEKIVGIKNFKNTFQETKILFSKSLNAQDIEKNIEKAIIDFDNYPVDSSLIYPLAFESGKYSRFKLDSNFHKNDFQLLYTKWVDNSINKQFADKFFYIKELNDVIGFVTIKKNESFSTIGLIAISEKHQGKGLGRKLLLKAEEYCVSENIFELKIPTQKENIPACYFYKKMGYQIDEEIIIKHYWKK